MRSCVLTAAAAEGGLLGFNHSAQLKAFCLLLPLFNRYHLPLAELGGDFYDELKSISSGYASFDYEEAEYRCGQPIVLGICWALCNVSLCTLS